jgi:hypothetical protein
MQTQAAGRARLSFCSADIPVCGFAGHSCPVSQTGDWKVARTRRLESLRYDRPTISQKMRCAPAGRAPDLMKLSQSTFK